MAEQQEEEVAPQDAANDTTPANNQPEDITGAKRRRKLVIIIAVITAVLVSILIVALSLIFIPGNSSCKSVGNMPKINLKSLRSIASQNDRALVRLGGHLELDIGRRGDFDETRYVEFNLKKVHHSIGEDGMVRLLLETDCASIYVPVFKDTNNRKYSVTVVYVKSLSPDYPFEQCNSMPRDIYFDFSQYYTCNMGVRYPCDLAQSETNGSELVDSSRGGKLREVFLYFSVFDLELDGDPVAVESGYFDLNPRYC